MAATKKEEKKAIKTALVAGTLQTLSNLFRDFRYLWCKRRGVYTYTSDHAPLPAAVV